MCAYDRKTDQYTDRKDTQATPPSRPPPHPWLDTDALSEDSGARPHPRIHLIQRSGTTTPFPTDETPAVNERAPAMTERMSLSTLK